jgi:hypothetical protein
MLASRTIPSASDLTRLADELEDVLQKLEGSPSILAYRMSQSSMPGGHGRPHIVLCHPQDTPRNDPNKPKAGVG